MGTELDPIFETLISFLYTELKALVPYLGFKGKEVQNREHPVLYSGSGLTPDNIPMREANFIMLFPANYYTSRECSNGYLIIDLA